MATFIVNPDETPAQGRTGGYRLIKTYRAVVAVNGAPLCRKKPDKNNHITVVIPPKFGDIIDMDMNSDRTGLVVLCWDDATIDLPFRGPLPRL